MTRIRLHWFVRYRCGCSDDAPRRRDLLEYCGTHGEDAVEWLHIPIDCAEARRVRAVRRAKK